MTQIANPYFLYSFGILMREGLEALLVVVALVAGIRQMGQGRLARDIYAGAIAALGVSIALAWVVNHVLSDDAGDSLEGCFQLVAAATLFMASSWLTAKAQANRWHEFIDARLESSARSAIPSVALALTAFMAVLREGGETVVFFQALLAGATERIEQHAVLAGVVGACVALALTFILLEKLALRAPIHWFFRATSVLLYALAIAFVGQGIARLQEAGVIRATFVGHIPTIKALGLFPTAQTLLAQASLAAIALAATFARPPRGVAIAGGAASPEHRATPTLQGL